MNIGVVDDATCRGRVPGAFRPERLDGELSTNETTVDRRARGRAAGQSRRHAVDAPRPCRMQPAFVQTNSVQQGCHSFRRCDDGWMHALADTWQRGSKRRLVPDAQDSDRAQAQERRREARAQDDADLRH